MYYAYLLLLNNNTIYTGSTDTLEARMQRHEVGGCLSTKNFRPIKLIWHCAFPSRAQARRFELYVKSGSGQAFRNKKLR